MTTVAGKAAEFQPDLALDCTMRAPTQVTIGQPVPVTVALHNRSATGLSVLTWGTPFEEAWFQPFVTVQRDGKPVSYGGATAKRGDPERDEYVGIAPGASRDASLDLAHVFDFSIPGRYDVVPRLVLHDVARATAPLPRPRAQHQPVSLRCPSLTVTVTPPRR